MRKSEHKKLIKLKDAAKKQLFKECYPYATEKTPLFIIFAPTESSDKEHFFHLLEGFILMPMKMIIVSDDEPEDVIKHPKGHITWVNTEDGRNLPKIDEYLLAADMALVFEEHHGNLVHIMKKGTIVIGHEESPKLENYHPNEETGNSFTYTSDNPWEIFRAVVRAQETYRFSYDWQNIVLGMLKKV